MKSYHLLASLLAVPIALGALPVSAQDYDRPPSGYGDDAGGGGYARDPDYVTPRAPADSSSDAASLGVRVNRLESRIREMTGQIEELQNANHRLIDQFQKFQADVDSRMASGSGARQKRSEIEAPKVASVDPAAAGDVDASRVRKPRHDDSYDPTTAAAGAPGSPKPLGSTAPSQPLDAASGGPMDLSGSRLNRGAEDDTLAPTLRLPSATPKQVGGTVTPSGTVIASTGPAGVPNSPRAEFDVALGQYRDRQYEEAEKGFSSFIQKNPKSKLAADATYYLGESYAQRGRSREAAEQYLKISTDYANSSRAPDAMLHLGISLKALGAKEQACATFTEVTRKYPNAPAYVRSGAEREAKRAQC